RFELRSRAVSNRAAITISAAQCLPSHLSRRPKPGPVRSVASRRHRNIGHSARSVARRSILAAGSRAITAYQLRKCRTKGVSRTTVDRVAEAREHTCMNAAPLPNHYKVIYADPPWTFATYSRKGKGRSAEAHYDCMSMAEIKALPVAHWAAEDCVLFLWTTDPLLEMA